MKNGLHGELEGREGIGVCGRTLWMQLSSAAYLSLVPTAAVRNQKLPECVLVHGGQQSPFQNPSKCDFPSG